MNSSKRMILTLLSIAAIFLCIQLTSSVSFAAAPQPVGLPEPEDIDIEEEHHPAGYVEMPWDSGLPDVDERISFEEAKEMLVDDDSPFINNKKGITSDTPASCFPASYEDTDDIRAYLRTNLPPLKDQGNYGTCWAHASAALFETYLIHNTDARDRHGIVNRNTIDYSELQLAYFYYRKLANPMIGDQGDQLNLLYKGDCDDSGHKSLLNFGGNIGSAAQTLINWKGMTDESVVPYSYAPVIETAEADGTASASGVISDDLGYDEDAAHLKNSYEINIVTNSTQVKQAIMSNRIAGISYYDSSSYYDAGHNSYFNYNVSSTNHAVCIVGWDDDFPKENFVREAETDGAWLIRNSWFDENCTPDGNVFSHEGYFWISYCDSSLLNGGDGRTAYVFEADTSEEYDHNYSYTPQIHWTGSYSFNGYANVYTASSDETLKAISFETSSNISNVDYTVEIYTNVTAGDTLTLGEPAASKTGTVIFPGLYTVELDSGVDIEEGQKFAVVVRSNTGGLVANEYPIENAAATSNFNGTTVKNNRESYFLSGSRWNDFSKNNNNSKYGNFFINALTVDRDRSSQVTGLRYTSFDNNSVNLSWSALDGAGSYQVQRSDSLNGLFSNVGSPLNSTTYRDTGLSSGRQYYYRVIPVMGSTARESRRSYIIGVMTAPDITETPQFDFTSYNDFSRFALLIQSTSEYDGCIVNYKREGDAVFTKTYAESIGSTRNKWRYFLSPGKYTFTVQVFKRINGTEVAGPVSEEKNYTVCAAPQNLVACYDGSRVILTWDSVENANFYTLYRNGQTFNDNRSYSSSTLYTDSTASSSSTYTYTVRAQYKSGNGYYWKIWFASDPVTVNTAVENYAVIFDTDGADPIATQNVNVGGRVTEPEAPEKPGYDFKGWYLEPEFEHRYDFSTVMTTGRGNFTLYAKFTNLLDQSLSFENTVVTKTYGDSDFTVTPVHSAGNGAVTFESSDGSVASVNSTTGRVTINGTGTARITATAARTATYERATASYTLNVNRLNVNVTISGNNSTVTYDGENHSVSGYTIIKDSELYPDSAVSFTGTAAIPGIINAGTAYMGLQSSMFSNTDTNFNVVFSVTDGYITVTRAESVITSIPSARNLTYSGSDQNLINGGSTSTGQMNYSLSESGVYSTSIPRAKDAGTYSVWYKVVGDSNHLNSDPASISVEIAKKTVTVTGIGADNKVYDGGTSAALDYSRVNISGKVSTDSDLSVTATGVFPDKNAGTGKTVSISGLRLTGECKDNYDLSQASQTSTTANITVKPVTISNITANSKTYDGSVSATFDTSNAVINGKINGDDLYVTASGTFNGAGAGTGRAVTINGFTLSGNDRTNYSVAANGNQNTSSADISRRPVSVTAKPQTVELGGSIATGPANAILRGALSGHALFSVDLVSGSTSSAGTGIITPSDAVIKTGNTDVTSNYDITYNTGVLTVTRIRASVVTAPQKASDLIYTGTALELLSSRGSANTSMEYSIDGTTYDTYVPSGTNAGSYTVYYRAASDADHESGEAHSLTVVISRASVTVRANNTSKTYGDADPELGSAVTGLVNNEDQSLISRSLSRGAGENAGTYVITPSGNRDQGNYTVTYETGTFTINRRTVTPVIDVSGTYVYTGNPISPDFTVRAGDSSLSAGDYTFSLSNNIDAGNGTITVTASAGGNYSFNAVSENFTINKADHSETAGLQVRFGSSKEFDLSRFVMPGGTPGAITGKSDPHGILSGDPDINGNILTVTATDDEDLIGETAQFNVPVRMDPDSNYNDYDISVTITSADKPAQDLSFASYDITLKCGETYYNSLDGAFTDLTYSSSDENVVTVDPSGTITANNEGNAVITVTASESAEYHSATSSYRVKVERIIIDKVPFTETGEHYASQNDNFAAESGSGKINKQVIDFSKVSESDVLPTELKMTVINGTRFTTKGKLQDKDSGKGSGGIKVKVNKKTLIATITCKTDGTATLTMEDGTTYVINITVEKPKAVKSEKTLSIGNEPVNKTVKDLFGTSVDSGELTIVKQKHSQASISSEGNILTINPVEKDSISVQYKYLNKKYKITIKVK